MHTLQPEPDSHPSYPSHLAACNLKSDACFLTEGAGKQGKAEAKKQAKVGVEHSHKMQAKVGGVGRAEAKKQAKAWSIHDR